MEEKSKQRTENANRQKNKSGKPKNEKKIEKIRQQTENGQHKARHRNKKTNGNITHKKET